MKKTTPVKSSLLPSMATVQSIIIFLLISINLSNVWAQDKRSKLEILSANELRYDELKGKKIRKLIGNVGLKHGDVIMHSDSAWFFVDINQVFAFGNVQIKQGDSLDIYSDSLKYFGDDKFAILYDNVRLKKGELTLQTDKLTYDTETKVGKYYNGATIKNGSTILKSRVGYYYERTQKAFFKDSILLIDPSYTLTSDTLQYDTKENISYFYGPTDIISDSSIIYCESGWYNSTNKTAFFKKNAVIHNKPQRISADSIYFDERTGAGLAQGNVNWVDSSENIQIDCGHAKYNKNENTVHAREHPVLINVIDSDSLYIAADILDSFIDSASNDSTDTVNHRIFYAYHNVKIYKSNMQGLCDSLIYSYRDSTIRLFQDPIVWVEESQMTADSISMLIKSQKLHSMDMIRNAFIVNHPDTTVFNQIKGKDIFGFFKDGKLDLMNVIGNGQSIYYAQDDSGAYIGANKAECSRMQIKFKEESVDRITFLEQPDAVFKPIQDLDPAKNILEGFIWLKYKRPKSKEDIYKTSPQAQSPDPQVSSKKED